jgi:hypothetical protein
MEFVYYFIGSLWGAAVIALLGFIYIEVRSIKRNLTFVRKKSVSDNADELRNGIKSDEE